MATNEVERIAERLKAARTYAGLSQDTVGRELGIPRTAVSQIESGRRRVKSDELVKLSSLYQRPISYFTEEHDQDEVDQDIALLARNYKDLSENDRSELVQFAQFLASRKKAEKD